jgi:hypothetical protein
MNDDFPFIVLCRAIRPTTQTYITVKVPEDCENVNQANQWIGEQFDWQFIPVQYDVVTPEVAEETLRV